MMGISGGGWGLSRRCWSFLVERGIGALEMRRGV